MAQVDDVAGHAQPGHEDPRPAVDDLADLGLDLVAGSAVSRSTPKGLSVSGADRGDLVDHDVVAAHGRGAQAAEAAGLADTAATRRWYETPPMPANITGCSMPSVSVRRVRMGAAYAWT